LTAAKRKAGQTACINNLKQLGLGMKMHVDDNGGVFPGLASRHNGFQPTDWIYWRTNLAMFPPVEKSPIIYDLANANVSLLRCPLDKNLNFRTIYDFGDGNGPYLYSYSLTGYGFASETTAGGSSDLNYGLASVYEGDTNNPTAHPFQESNVRNPSGKIMLAEEPGSNDSQDNPTGSMPIQDGRWVPPTDPLSSRHSSKADVTFVDGHVQAVTSDFGADVANSRPDL
jgi:prepilin-type processing-associated H-X9-DG protein